MMTNTESLQRRVYMDKAALAACCEESAEKDILDRQTRIVRQMLGQEAFIQCREMIAHLMAQFPDFAQPHNLMGLLLEKEGRHREALSHFRAAVALDPTHRPSARNLEQFSQFFHEVEGAFEECDCGEQAETGHCSVHFDADGIGYVTRESVRMSSRRHHRFFTRRSSK